jgi:hypothetical protein
MKLRMGFVSNSSSSSFVANLILLGESDLKKIIEYIESDRNEDGWSYNIDEEKGLINGYTSMDNGAFGEFLIEIGINKVVLTSYDQ